MQTFYATLVIGSSRSGCTATVGNIGGIGKFKTFGGSGTKTVRPNLLVDVLGTRTFNFRQAAFQGCTSTSGTGATSVKWYWLCYRVVQEIR
ncbi:uncharacterized protein LAJ45_08503 [Morchella importuna]|uniref:uncharacterized protein n=1 Tax=Morchella importuna TaxID=1174673 RepID=UPI001E8DEE80|nr:uncharacterized protein LAJ45_08503 [Morchella importuna]KAH8147347.1 hypothetical protein LAJ45_08503 [Morchella importuna]